LDVSPSGPDIRYIHNDFIIYLPKPIPPGGKSELSVSWDYILNANSHLREGMVDPGTFFVAYFFPRIAVYDDIDGWDDSKYTGTPEFYNDFGNFDVTIRVPENWFVWATGELQNPGEVLSEKVYERYKAAHLSDDIVHIIGASDLLSGNLTKRNSQNIWKFNAENVSDFAFGTSDHYLWDGSGLQVNRETGRRVFIDAAYNRNSTDFYQVAQIARDAIEYMSFQFPAVAFPYPKMTVFNGLSEMEYPMMVNDISTGSISETIKLTSHEIFHSYFPFYTGMNETKYAWMDEGLTSYGESIIASALDSLPFSGFYFSSAFRAYAGDDNDVPIFVSSEYLKSPVYYGNSYPKAATFFKILNDYLGEEKFSHALHAFINHWKGKHPIPHDLLFTFIDDTGEDLAWLIKPWIFEFGFVDLALASFDKSEDGYMATILKKGPYPTPFSLRIEYKNGEIQNIRKDVSVWKPDRKSHTFEIKTDEEIVSVRIINEQYFDIDLSNNSWK
nr:peptidase [Bacteroidota bacterium]